MSAKKIKNNVAQAEGFDGTKDNRFASHEAGFVSIQQVIRNYKPDPNQKWFIELDERSNKLINAARGRDECGINLDEVIKIKKIKNKTK